mgnify:FL=1
MLDYLFTWTIRARRKSAVRELAEKNAMSKNKSMIIFSGITQGEVYHLNSNNKFKSETFKGNFLEIIDQMADNSCVIIVSYALEYVDDIEKTLEILQRVSGNDLYILSYESNSPRTFWDYKIKQILNKSYYVPNEKNSIIDDNMFVVTTHKPNAIQLRLQTVYRYLFKVIPYSWF